MEKEKVEPDGLYLLSNPGDWRGSHWPVALVVLVLILMGFISQCH